MALTYEKVYGHKKGDGPETTTGPQPYKKFGRPVQDDDRENGGPIPEEKPMSKYIAAIDGFTEKGARHMKGEDLKVEISEDRAAALITAGYIAEKAAPAAAPEAPAKKEAAVPENKMLDGEETSKKGATGKGAGLLKKKK